MVSVQGVVKRFGEPGAEGILTLDGIDLAVGRGEVVSIIGPSGCGKSTLLYMIAGLVPVSSGSIVVSGKAVTKPDPRIGIVFQEFRIFPWKTVQQNVVFGLELQGLGDARKRAEATQRYIRMVGLEGFENRYPKELSGGMKQRVAIAQTFACDPELVLMDEPLGSVDSLTRETLQDEILKIWVTSGKTIVLVTHSIEEAIYLGSKVVVLSPRPTRVLKTFDVSLPYPRTPAMRTGAIAAELREEIWTLLRAGERG